MKKREFKRNLAALFAVSLMASAVTAPFSVSAETGSEETKTEKIRGYQWLDEMSFNYKLIPWHITCNYPAKQDIELTDAGEAHIKIKKASGGSGEHWDLEFRHTNLTLWEGYTYHVKFTAKASRDGLQVIPRIENLRGDEVYCAFDGEKMSEGKALGGEWGKPVELTTEYQTFTGKFEMDKSYDNLVFSFTYADGTEYEGNAEDGDEIWFDEISLISETDPCIESLFYDPYGYTSRSSYYSHMENNFISVNQVGYFPRRSKVAVLSDNYGDLVAKSEKTELKEAAEFEVINALTGETAFKGTSSELQKDHDSNDTVCKLDFTDLTEPGIYYIKAGSYRSAEFKICDDLYSVDGSDLLTSAMNYFYQNRSGIDISENFIVSDGEGLAHKGGHKEDTASVQKVWKNFYVPDTDAEETYRSSDVTADGGWYESGTHAKNMIEGGSAVWTLQNMYERSVLVDGSSKFDDGSGVVVIPETDNSIPDVLDEAAFEIDWMSQMKVDNDEPFWGEKAGGLYYHEISDSSWTGLAIKPWSYEEWGTVRIAKPPTFAATLNYAACAAQAARLWEPYDHERSEKYMKSAVEAYRAYKKNYYEPDLTETMHPEYNTPCPAEVLKEDSLYAPAWQNETGRLYDDIDVTDEAYAAACEIFVSAKIMDKDYAGEFLEELESYKGAYMVFSRIDAKNAGGSVASFNCTSRSSAGSLTLALHKDLLPEDKAELLDESITEVAGIYLNEEKKQGYGTPYVYDGPDCNDPENLDPDIRLIGYERDSNGLVLNNAIVMAYAYDVTGDSKYLDGVTTAMDYLFGTNPLSFSYVTGYGTYSVKYPYHRYWARCFSWDFPKAPEGVIVGGPASMPFEYYLRLLGFKPGKADNAAQRVYADNIEEPVVNNTSVNLNASLAWVASFLQDAGGSSGYISDVTGDVNGNGIVDVTDLSILAISLVENEKLGKLATDRADVTRDGRVDLTDLATLRMFLSKKIDSFE